MLARCGIGTLQIFDLDVVNDVNLNRMFFRIAHVGLAKVEVVVRVLNSVNPDVKVVPHQGDIMRWEYEEQFEEILAGCDLVIQGLDNLPVRNISTKNVSNCGVLSSTQGRVGAGWAVTFNQFCLDGRRVVLAWERFTWRKNEKKVKYVQRPYRLR